MLVIVDVKKWPNLRLLIFGMLIPKSISLVTVLGRVKTGAGETGIGSFHELDWHQIHLGAWGSHRT